MIVTKIEKIKSTYFKVYIDEEFAFRLTKGELSRFFIEENKEISQEKLHEIQSAVTKRAKKYILHLLEDMDRTEEQLRTKLKDKDYTKETSDAAISYAKGFGYINDANFALRFLESKKHQKSKKELYYLMLQKGFDKEDISAAFSSGYQEDVDEEIALENLMHKRKFTREDQNEKEIKKAQAYFLRKGFSYDIVKRLFLDR
ncbi:regulatory protein [Aequitasia blattaphilus]|uniref:Regulatory protein RecX n=1 Tax=Aequitasia blattaphilus TaxID=2949332 RepID=A0ABT1E717_9FIRM|nr:regulatory protein RecX [Aequitasia blattaphilus]MCP1101622.1 recombination regulator RecX [Aequitasia blattaphilus]MCR8614262.1 recombination regulator RecX [Aequitasia blattaphilus]